MSADGEVEVSVRAEGVDQAAGEMGGDALAETADGGGGAPGGGGGAGRFGRLLAKIAGLVAFLGPILDVLKVFANIGKAFIAPLAVLLLRLFQPLAVALLKVLPVWFDIFDGVSGFLSKLDDTNQVVFGVVSAALMILQAVDAAKAKLSDLLAWGDSLITEVQNLPSRIWSFVQRLPGQIATSLSGLIPGVGGGDGFLSGLTGGGDGGDSGDGLLSDIRDALGGSGGGDARDRQPIVNLGGGLSAFIERIERDPNKDIQ